MRYAVSDLCVLSQGVEAWRAIPPEWGVEWFQCEAATPAWRGRLAKALEGRAGFSVHAAPEIMSLSLPEALRDARFREAVEVAAAHGAQYVVLHPTCGDILDMRSHRAPLREKLGEYVRLAKACGVPLALENLFPDSQGRMALPEAEFRSLLDDLPEARALIDIGHALLSGWSLPGLIEALRGRIVAYHVHNNDGVRDSHDRIGRGRLDPRAFMEACVRHTPEAILVLEYEKQSTLADCLEDIALLRALEASVCTG